MSRVARNDGFTLVEMLVVLSLVALLLVVSLPYSTSSGEARKLDAASQIIAAKLRETQTLSLSSNRERSLTLDIGKGLLVQADPDKIFEIPKGITLSVVTSGNEILDDAGAFRFFPDGGSTGGKIILSSGDSRREIAISWLTGGIVVSSGEAP
jgi:general secretion pathway protein H